MNSIERKYLTIFQEFPDPLADWEELEPELGQTRRSLHLSESSYSALFRPRN